MNPDGPGRRGVRSDSHVKAAPRLFTFSVPGEPVAWARTRVNLGGKLFTPNKVRAFKTKVQLVATASGVQMLEGPVELEVRFVFEWPRTLRRKRKMKDWTWLTGKPDLDNLVKGIADSLNGLAYKDDAQVVRLVATKMRGHQTRHPSTEITVKELKALSPEESE